MTASNFPKDTKRQSVNLKHQTIKQEKALSAMGNIEGLRRNTNILKGTRNTPLDYQMKEWIVNHGTIY